jgi:hypothetical protein
MPRKVSKTPWRVFVSHSGVDSWVAKQIAREISECGAAPFLDETDIDVGAEFEDRLLKSLEDADELVVLLTPWAMDRKYVWMEIGAAWGRRLPIVVLLHGLTVEELQSRPGVPVLLKQRDSISLNDVDRYLAELKRRVTARTPAKKKR